MADVTMDDLEQRISELRVAIRRALAGGDRTTAISLRAQLRDAELQWDLALQGADPEATFEPRSLPGSASLLPMRDQVHQVLTLLGVPAAPKLIVTVHEAFFGGELASTKLTSLRRDEERSYLSAPNTRPYYICSALTTEGLTAARGLLAVSTWTIEQRIIGSLSPRVDYLTSAIRLAEQVQRTGDPSPQVLGLLWRFANNIPSAMGPFDSGDPKRVIVAAQAELDVHYESDLLQRKAAAERARHLPDVQQLFGAEPLRAVRRSPSSR